MKLEAFLDAAWDWSERNDIPCVIWRDANDEWAISFELKDSRGWFRTAPVNVLPKKERKGGETPETEAEYRERTQLVCSDRVRLAREQRMQAFTKTKAYGRAA